MKWNPNFTTMLPAAALDFQPTMCWCGKTATVFAGGLLGGNRPLCADHAPQYEIKCVREAQYSPETMDLAKKAVATQAARRDEDVKEWAARIAADVAGAAD